MGIKEKKGKKRELLGGGERRQVGEDRVSQKQESGQGSSKRVRYTTQHIKNAQMSD